MAAQRNIVQPADNPTEVKVVLETLDLPLRYVMTTIGCLPSSSLPQLPRSAQLVLLLPQLVLIVLLFIPSVNAMFNAWDPVEDADTAVFIFKVLILEVSSLTPIDSLLFSVSGHLFSTFKDYYKQLTVVQQHLNSLQIAIPSRLLKTISVILTIAGILLANVISFLFVFDYVHRNWRLDRIFSPTLTNDSYHTLEKNQHVLRGLGQFYVVTYAIFISLKLTYFNTVVAIVFLTFRCFNKRLEATVLNCPEKLKSGLPSYRHAHLELCHMVSNMDRMLRAMLGTMLLAYSVGTLLIFYLVSIGLTKDFEARGILIYWCVMFCFFETLTILHCQLIQYQVC